MRYKKIQICLTSDNLELIEKIQSEKNFSSRSDAINYVLENISSNITLEKRVKCLTDKYIDILNGGDKIETR